MRIVRALPKSKNPREGGFYRLTGVAESRYRLRATVNGTCASHYSAPVSKVNCRRSFGASSTDKERAVLPIYGLAPAFRGVLRMTPSETGKLYSPHQGGSRKKHSGYRDDKDCTGLAALQWCRTRLHLTNRPPAKGTRVMIYPSRVFQSTASCNLGRTRRGGHLVHDTDT